MYRCNRFACAVAVAVFGLLILSGLPPVQANVIYQDNFGRTGSLSASCPAPVNSPSATYTAANFTTNGASAVGTSGAEAYLPLTVGPLTYTASVTITPNTNGTDTTDWLAFGFTTSSTLGSAFYSDGNPELWIGYRENGQAFSFYNGPLANVQIGGTATAGSPDRFTITLNGVSGAFAITDSLNLINRTGTLSPAALASINGIGFSTYVTSSGTFQNLSLTTPEPSSLILWGLGAVGLLVATRRRRRM